MYSIECELCHDCGYLDYDVHCTCSRGVFYEGRDELNMQRLFGELDDVYEFIDNDQFDEYIEDYSSLYLLSSLPFFDGIKITDDTEYDDNSDDEYYDIYANAPWISSYELNIHEDGDCTFPCDACAYYDSTW